MECSELNLIQKSRKKTFSQIGLACFTILIVASVLQLAANYLAARLAPQWTVQPWYIWAITFIPLYIIGVPIGIALFARVPSEKAAPRRLRFRDLLIFLVMCFPMMYIGNIIGSVLNTLLHLLLGTEISNPLSSYIFGSNIWLSILFMVLLAPVIEEFIFRKLIIDRIRSYGEGTAVLVSALMFGLFHGNLNQFFYAFGIGAIFAFIYVKTGRLRYSVFMHMTINLLGGILAPFLVKGIDLNTMTQMNQAGTREVMRYLAEHLPQLMAFGLYSLLNFGLVITGFVLLVVKRRTFYFEHGSRQFEKGKGFTTIFVNLGMILFVLSALALFVLSLL
jgi:uncharacterized protein